MDSMKLVPYIENAKLSDYAASCAKALGGSVYGSGRTEAQELRRSCQKLEKCHSVLRQRYGQAHNIPAACEWLLDNRYMIQREYPDCLYQLEHARRQRCCRGRLMVMELCRALLQAGQGKLSAERCGIFLSGFQSVTVLQRAELMLFPAALRCTIIEAIAQCAEKLQASSAPDTLAEDLAALFGSLRLLSTMDMDSILDAADVCGDILSHDPGGCFSRMDRQTRSQYLEKLSAMAAAEGMEEQLLAEKLMARARAEDRHIGFYLFAPPSARRAFFYIAALSLLTLFISLFIAYSSGSILSALLLLLPVWSMVKGLTDFVMLRCIQPSALPRLDMSEGIPPEGKSICVISVLLGCCDPSRLEELRLASRREGKNLSFGLLADLPGADREHMPGDEKLLEDARRAVDRLNEKYGGGFYFFCRGRSFDGEGWSGHERKRGALLELSRLLCGETSQLSVHGDVEALKGTEYIISLDADTRIYPGSLSKLIGAALHPLCRPVIDKKKSVVVSGHAIIHPRIETELESSAATDFAIIFSGGGGSDPYGGLCTELYMDAFQNGGFAGKGIIHAPSLLQCTASRFPEGRILSHDALEGAFLRGAYMSDAEFSDAFPANALSYYKRQHRWIRGDWQNAPWLFCRELSAMDRFRLFDSLRRSLNAPMTLLAILVGFFISGPGLTLAAWAALLSLLQSVFIALAESGLSRPGGTRLRRHSRLLNGVGGAIVRCFMQLWLLPFEAWVSLSAALTALWRMLVSHKRLLQWQTFAQSGAGGSDFGGHIKSMWAAVVLGVVLMGFAPGIIGKASGLMWLLSPAAAAALALPAFKEQELSSRDRELLICAVSDHWLYLKELSGKEDNYLPPDNFQQQPPVGAAHRSSPTNIGLAMAAAAASAEVGIIKQNEALGYISRMLTSLEKMPRYKGHYYNWYDTRTLRPLLPAHISTVDSGNMYAGLLVARAALERWGRYELAGRIDALLKAMDFSLLYDNLRELFYISYDTKNERGVGGWYDLMASEAMLTSFLALAKGDVPLRHWRRLSRAQLQKDGYRGLASWTGTMFEYMMPALFLPVYRSSLLFESDRFCLYVQKRRRYPGKPWGISESAFYALDPGLNYRYKAHGCPALALKRGQDADMVISPYSSFLALAADPQAAVKNLRRLKDLGAYGRWGFIEALDFTPERCSREDGEQVRCWMAHHVSMSMLAAVNALDKDSVRELFLSAPEMSAHTLLLQEKLPDGRGLIRRDTERVPERPAQKLRRPWQLRGNAEDRKRHGALISNGAYSLRLDSLGNSAAFLSDICVYGSEAEQSLSLRLEGRSLLPADDAELWELGDEQARWQSQADGLSCTVSRGCAEAELGEFIDLEIKCDKSRHCQLELSFSPVLAKLRDYLNHSAYWKLGITAHIQGRELILRRISKGDDKELWFCLCCSENAVYSADSSGGDGHLADPLVKATVPLKISGGLLRLRFALCLGSSRNDAVEGARRILFSSGKAAGNMAGAAAARLGMSRDELGAAMELVLPLWENRLHSAAAQKELWRYGISGDLPIICCDGRASESEWLTRAFCLIKSCGMEAELVFFSEEQGEYMQPLLRRIEGILAPLGLEALLGSPGGIFILGTEARETIASRAAVFIGEDRTLPPSLPRPRDQLRRRPGMLPDFAFTDSGFEYSGAVPPRIWQHILTNASLSAFAADFGPAGLWLRNAREMRLIPPPSDIKAGLGAESIRLSHEGRSYSLFAADDGLDCRVVYSPGLARWQKRIGGREIESSMFIHPESDLRFIIVKGAEGMELCWELQPQLGSRDAASLKFEIKDSIPVFTNPESYFAGLEFMAAASADFEIGSDFCPPALSLRMKAERNLVLLCGCADRQLFKTLLDRAKAEQAMNEALSRWREVSGRLRLRCGNGAMEHYMNSWAVYQTLACRLLARSSIYQSGGAIGFRDQLQDSVNLLLIDSGLARAQIIDCCRHQYEQGDVMHWWHPHPDGDKGIRSRCSDDLLWLVWALCEYCEATGDTKLCYESIPYISSPTLREDERDRYEVPQPSARSETVLCHARAALDMCISRGFGEHGLPFMGSGDWNDGLDKVQGESVWLGWFFSHCAHRLAMLMQELREDDFSRYEAMAEKVGKAADACHNGMWYSRAFFPDGSPLGDRERIDSVAQSWAALCPWSTRDRLIPALLSAMDRLQDRGHRLIKLLDPPYSPDERRPGYISGYGEGFRENGGQYTHAAIWLALAALRQGFKDEAWDMLCSLLPETHRQTEYGAEPFVLPADLCSARGREGLAGWTWYTGSAGWFFRVVACELFGLKLRGGRLYIRPALPELLSGFELEYRSPGGREYHICCRGDSISVNGREYKGEGLEL